MQRILITGATGNIGKHVVSGLKALGKEVRIGQRNRSDDPEATFLDLSDPSSYDNALLGISRLFLLRPPAISNTSKTLNVLIDKAYSQGIEHIVFVSVSGAESNSLVPHHAVEQKLIKSGRSYTILRPGFFSQNLESAYRMDILNDSCLYLPSGRGQINFIDTRDIAAVAVQALVNPEVHARRAYTLAGKDALTFYDVANLLSLELNRQIKYREASAFSYFIHLLRQGDPIMKAFIQTILHVGIRSGQANIISSTASELLARETITMGEYVHENREKWLC
ncbi:NmrA family NAD(P)-binding protein [Alkalimarinus sediminis]|uniref:NmrA family NAD(P)-binding protein n=1 Tax=Alkalimarinus sediminis TaxID=1632866 RepID=A0A9E8HL15_9ALTE|nr:NmrA family NAD(P)-binding protein [Alkalimarinus sediminis]UZW76404.1 NmrA family NAD(P)-binding protein [Alkalimarinus sediminis]